MNLTSKKIIFVFSKLEHLLPKARNQLWWKLSVQLKHHGRMENIRGKIIKALFLQLAQDVKLTSLVIPVLICYYRHGYKMEFDQRIRHHGGWRLSSSSTKINLQNQASDDENAAESITFV